MQEFRGVDFAVEAEAEPGGLRGAFLLRTYGRLSIETQREPYRWLLARAAGPVLNLIIDSRASESFIDYAGFAEIHGTIARAGFRRLNLVIVDLDPGRAYTMRFGDEVGRLQGLEVISRLVGSMTDALRAMQSLMATPSAGHREALPEDGARR